MEPRSISWDGEWIGLDERKSERRGLWTGARWFKERISRERPNLMPRRQGG